MSRAITVTFAPLNISSLLPLDDHHYARARSPTSWIRPTDASILVPRQHGAPRSHPDRPPARTQALEGLEGLGRVPRRHVGGADRAHGPARLRGEGLAEPGHAASGRRAEAHLRPRLRPRRGAADPVPAAALTATSGLTLRPRARPGTSSMWSRPHCFQPADKSQVAAGLVGRPSARSSRIQPSVSRGARLRPANQTADE